MYVFLLSPFTNIQFYCHNFKSAHRYSNIMRGHYTTDVFKRRFIVLHSKWQWLNWLIYWKWQRESEKETKSVTPRTREKKNVKARRKYLCPVKDFNNQSQFLEFQDHLQLFKSENPDIHRNSQTCTAPSPFRKNCMFYFIYKRTVVSELKRHAIKT